MSDHKDHTKPFGRRIKTGGTGSILASLFQTILFDLNITSGRFGQLLERYIAKAIPKNIKEMSSLRGNLKKELTKDSMSWKVFVKGLVFLNVQKFDLTVRLYHANGTETTHTKQVSLHHAADLELEDNKSQGEKNE